MDYKQIRKVCKDRFKSRSGKNKDDQETLHPCPACNGTGDFKLEDGDKHRNVIYPFCDGIGATDHFMMGLYRDSVRKSTPS